MNNELDELYELKLTTNWTNWTNKNEQRIERIDRIKMNNELNELNESTWNSPDVVGMVKIWCGAAPLLNPALTGRGRGGSVTMSNFDSRERQIGNPMFKSGTDQTGRGDVKDIDKMAI